MKEHGFLRKEIEELMERSQECNETEKDVLCQTTLSFLTYYFDISQSILFLSVSDKESTYLVEKANINKRFNFGAITRVKTNEGLVGACFTYGKMIKIDNLPKNYLMDGKPDKQLCPEQLLLLPLKAGNDVIGAVEMAVRKQLTNNQINKINTYCNSLAEDLYYLQSNSSFYSENKLAIV